MTESQAVAFLQRMGLNDQYGLKMIDDATRREIVSSLCALPDGALADAEGARFPPDLLREMVGVLEKHPHPPLLKLLLAGYRRIAERPDAKTRARLEAIEALAGPLAKSRRSISVVKLTFRRVALPARPAGAQKKQLARAEREFGSLEGVELFEILDERGQHKYDAVLMARDDGWVFSAGTTKTVATFAQGGVEGRSEGLCSALEQALAATART
jgi:hypothetical protein